MDVATRASVRRRAVDACEYCRLREEDDFFTFHIEHIVARQHHGGDDLSNLALACQHCNQHKGPNLSGIDPETGRVVLLFHPRRDDWDFHFRRVGPRLVGLTPTGRATVRVLAMNDPDRVELRARIT